MLNSYAFFDVDDTVISMKSMFSFIDIYFSQNPNITLQNTFNKEMQSLIQRDVSWEIANKIYYSYFQHFPIHQVESACQQWFDQYAANKSDFYHDNIVRIIKQHQQDGVECVFVSGSFRELLQPIADELDVRHILSINLERKEEGYTGEIIPPQTIGEGKATALAQFLAQHQGDASHCYAYGDDISDAPMLAMVGNPIAVSGGRRLEAYAKTQGWPVVAPRLSAA